MYKTDTDYILLCGNIPLKGLCDIAALIVGCLRRLVLQQSWVPGMNGAPALQENHKAWCSDLDVSMPDHTCAMV